MPWYLAFVLPVVFQALTPFVVAGIKSAVGYLDKKLPNSVIVAIAGVTAEAINQGQSLLTGVALPAGASGVVAIALRELNQDLSEAASTPDTESPKGI